MGLTEHPAAGAAHRTGMLEKRGPALLTLGRQAWLSEHRQWSGCVGFKLDGGFMNGYGRLGANLFEKEFQDQPGFQVTYILIELFLEVPADRCHRLFGGVGG